MLFDFANLPYWIFLGLGVLLFLLVIFAGGGDSDVDADLDLDVDADIDADVDADADIGSSFNTLQILGWLGVGQAPLILLLATDFSLLGVIGWMLNVWVGSFLGHIPTHFFGVRGVVSIASLILSLFTGSMIARPIGKIFASFGEDASSDRLIGCIGTVSSAIIPIETQSKIGQVDVLDPSCNLVTISAMLPEWAKVMPRRGEKVIVIEGLSRHYLVITKNSSDQDRWLDNSSKIKM